MLAHRGFCCMCVHVRTHTRTHSMFAWSHPVCDGPHLGDALCISMYMKCDAFIPVPPFSHLPAAPDVAPPRPPEAHNSECSIHAVAVASPTSPPRPPQGEKAMRQPPSAALKATAVSIGTDVRAIRYDAARALLDEPSSRGGLSKFRPFFPHDSLFHSSFVFTLSAELAPLPNGRRRNHVLTSERRPHIHRLISRSFV